MSASSENQTCAKPGGPRGAAASGDKCVQGGATDSNGGTAAIRGNSAGSHAALVSVGLSLSNPQ